MDTMYYVIADPDCSMNYSIIKGKRTRYNVTPYFKFNFEKEEEQNCCG